MKDFELEKFKRICEGNLTEAWLESEILDDGKVKIKVTLEVDVEYVVKSWAEEKYATQVKLKLDYHKLKDQLENKVVEEVNSKIGKKNKLKFTYVGSSTMIGFPESLSVK